MGIFHCYVKLPEGKQQISQQIPAVDTVMNRSHVTRLGMTESAPRSMLDAVWDNALNRQNKYVIRQNWLKKKKTVALFQQKTVSVKLVCKR